MAPSVPTDRTVHHGEMADYWFEDGVLVSLSKPVRRTVSLIAANAEFVKGITGRKPVPLLIYLADSPVPDKETRRFSAETLPKIYTAMAMVAPTALSRLVMNIVFGLKPPPIPTKSFTDPVAAKKWLNNHTK